MIHEDIIKQKIDECKWDEAYDILSLKKIEDMSINELSQLGWCQSRLSKYTDAILTFETLIIKEPNMAKWYYMKGYQYYMQKYWKEACSCFEKALQIFPDYFVVKYRISYAYLQIAGEYLKFTKDVFWKAIAHLKDCHKIYENYSDEKKEKEKSTYFDICFLHGKVLTDMKDQQHQAITLFKKALEVKKDDDCLYQLSKTYLLVNDIENAEFYLPNANKYYVKELKANILFTKGLYVESNNILLNLIKFRKKDYIFIKIAENYLKQEDIQMAYKYSNEAIRFGKDNHKNYLYLANILNSNKQFKSAVELYEKAKKTKLKKFNLECPEASREIDKILELTNGQTYNEEGNLFFQKDNKGVILEYNSNRGFGFLEQNDKTKVFFHISNYKIKEPPIIGKEVLYKIKTNKNKIEAYDITYLD